VKPSEQVAAPKATLQVAALKATLEALQKRRALVFYPALILSIVGIFRRGALLSLGCGALWLLAGAICLMEARTLLKMGLKSRNTGLNALGYLAIGVLFLFRR
jgi:hypothetical protein